MVDEHGISTIGPDTFQGLYSHLNPIDDLRRPCTGEVREGRDAVQKTPTTATDNTNSVSTTIAVPSLDTSIEHLPDVETKKKKGE
jgi:hypothetical protein